MPLSEQEEFELLSLERERAMGQSSFVQPSQAVQPPGTWQRIKDFAQSTRWAPITGGPLGMIATQGMKNIDEMMEKGAYATGGAVTDIGASAGLPPEVSAGAGYAANVGVRAIPSIVGAVAGKGAETVTQPIGRKILQSALKPSSKDLASKDAYKAIDTMLEGGFNVTPGGVAKMRALVQKLSSEVDDFIKGSPASIDRTEVRKELLKELSRFRKQVNPESDVKSILKSWNEFKRTAGPLIPVQKAQELKQGTYRVLADKYAHKGTVDDEAATQAQMALARGLRKGIEKEIPSVVKPNTRMNELINAIEIAEKRSGVAGNRDIGGIAWLAENPLSGVGMLADRSPWLKSYLARYLHSGMPATGAISGTVLGQQDQDRELIEALRRK